MSHLQAFLSMEFHQQLMGPNVEMINPKTAAPTTARRPSSRTSEHERSSGCDVTDHIGSSSSSSCGESDDVSCRDVTEDDVEGKVTRCVGSRRNRMYVTWGLLMVVLVTVVVYVKRFYLQ